MVLSRIIALLALIGYLSACFSDKASKTEPKIEPVTKSPAAIRTIADQDISDSANTADWLAYGRTHDEQRFSPLDDINAANVAKLGVAWYRDLPGDVGLISTPLVVDGIMFFTGTMNIVRAVDARSGELIWKYDPEVGKELAGKKKSGWVHNRGLSTYGNKIFATTWDGRLIALHRETGKLLWSTRTYELDKALYITGHPKAFKGLVVIGNGGTEFGPARGYITAYNTETGEQVWRFYTVPGNPADGFENPAMEMAAKTWSGEWWKNGGGGTVWHAITYDAELDTLYFGTGNGTPWNRRIRSPGGGDNLFLSSIVAVNPDTGEYKWHYQTTPGESWDYNSNMDIVLADLDIEGKTVKAILHAPKNAFFYVIDRTNGKLVSAEPYAYQNWASHIDLETGRPVENPKARYENFKGDVEVFPSNYGAHSWHAMSYNPQTGLVYLPTLHMGSIFNDDNYTADWQAVSFQYGAGADLWYIKGRNEHPGSLQAWDPIQQKAIWTVNQEDFFAAGTLTTAGDLVFQGDVRGKFKAYSASTGKELWQFDAGLGISAPPITYKLDGRQMVSVLVGYGGAYAARLTQGSENLGWSYGAQTRRLLTFALDGEAVVPTQAAPQFVKPLLDKDLQLDVDLAADGEVLYYAQGCYACHGVDVVAAGMAPDLRASPLTLASTAEIFAGVVRNGERVSRGMPGFPVITDTELLALRHFIRMKAHQSLDDTQAK